METPMQSVLFNELILERIFRHLPTPDLLLKVNRTVSKWNQVAAKFVQLKRLITLTEKNILSYCNFINNGGVGATFINLKLVYNGYEHVLNPEDFEKIISALTKLAENVQNIHMKSSNWEINTSAASSNSFSPSQLEANLFRYLLHNCKNIENLALDIYSYHNTPPDIYKLLDLEKLEPFNNLKAISISLPLYCGVILSTFLEAAPNVQSIQPINHMDLQDLQRLEMEFPESLGKFEFFLTLSGFDDELANFFTAKNFQSLRQMQIRATENFGKCEKVLQKYADQLVNLKLFLGGNEIPDEFGTPQLFLPLMKNLETLIMDFSDAEWFGSNFAACRFPLKDGSERNFPKLHEVAMEIPCKFETMDDFMNARNFFEQVCLATFKHPPSHPVFPNVRKILVKAGEMIFEGGDRLRIKPKVKVAIKKYFPNLEYDSEDDCEYRED